MNRLQVLGLAILVMSVNALPFMAIWRSPGRWHAITLVFTGILGIVLLYLGAGKDRE